MVAENDVSSLVGQVHPGAIAICARLREKGNRGWIVGGCVRDLLLGKTVSDWDVAHRRAPGRAWRAAFARVIPTGIEHGTVTVVLEGRTTR